MKRLLTVVGLIATVAPFARASMMGCIWTGDCCGEYQKDPVYKDTGIEKYCQATGESEPPMPMPLPGNNPNPGNDGGSPPAEPVHSGGDGQGHIWKDGTNPGGGDTCAQNVPGTAGGVICVHRT